MGPSELLTGQTLFHKKVQIMASDKTDETTAQPDSAAASVPLMSIQPLVRPCLYIVATPIGNMADMTCRAVQVLREVDHLACEDTRVTRQLLQRFGISVPTSSYHDHNGDLARPRLLAMLEEGKAVGLVSDAGTPLISDPGYKLVAEAKAAGFPVCPIPGASALTAAISAAGLPSNQFGFFGFPPQKSSARKAFFAGLKARHETLVFYESARRLQASLEDMQEVFGGRKVSVARELTKKFEEVVTDDIAAVITYFDRDQGVKGECVVLIEGALKTDGESAALDTDDVLKKVSIYLRDKDAAALTASLLGGSRKTYYDRLLAIKRDSQDHDR